MANVTLTIDDRLLRRARIRALEEGTSLSAMVTGLLETATGPDEDELDRQALAAFLESSKTSSFRSSGPWKRDDIYKERMSRYDG